MAGEGGEWDNSHRMDNATTAESERTFDVIHFIRGFPSTLNICDENCFTAFIDSSQFPFISNETAGLPGADFEKLRSLAILGVRLESDSARDAVSFTRHYAEAVIDGLSLGLERPLPVVSAIAVVHDHAKADPTWISFSPVSWVHFSATPPTLNAAPTERAQVLLQAAAPLLDIVSKVFPQHDSEVARRLAHSLKMYRHGATANSFAVEFICKFAALEALVTSEHSNIGEQLRTRLPTLFRKDGKVTAGSVEDIWLARNVAVHASAGFYSKHLAGSKPVHQHTKEVEFLYLGAVAFFAAHLKTHTRLTELWKEVVKFELPGWALERTSQSLHAHEYFMDSNKSVPWAPALFERELTRARRQREEK